MTPVRIEKEQLLDCLAVMAQGYEESAQRFGMTEENCPYRGRTRLPLEVLEREFETGQIYGAFAQGRLVGVLSLQKTGDVLMINDLVVLPCWQGQGIGGGCSPSRWKQPAGWAAAAFASTWSTTTCACGAGTRRTAFAPWRCAASRRSVTALA